MKILGYEYGFATFRSDELSAVGHCNTERLLIRVVEGQSRAQRESTVLHEVLEALKYHLQLRLPHPSLMALEAGLYQVLTDAGVSLAPLTRELDALEKRGKR